MTTCDLEKVPSGQKNAFFSFIKTLASFKGDLASLTAPPFLLSPQSIVEFSSYWAEHPSLFLSPTFQPTTELRALAVLKWFLSTLRQQHSNKDEQGRKKRMKPLNPFLGELFEGYWDSEMGRTELVAEQVSHHPPVTACRIWNREAGVSFQGNIAPKAYFSSTVHIERKGYSIYHLEKHDEDYLITLPKLYIEGIMTGSLAPELSGTSYIRASTGYTAKIEYQSKGWISGKRNSFTASLYRDGCEKEPNYILEGQWSGEYTVTKVGTKEVEKVDISSLKPTQLKVKPISAQHPLETRKAWQHVASAIHKNDYFAVGYEKSKIENEQRELRKREKEEGREFQRRYFSRVKVDPVVERLLGDGLRTEIDGHDGVWRWDDEKQRSIEERMSSGMKSPTRIRIDSLDSGVGGLELDGRRSTESS